MFEIEHKKERKRSFFFDCKEQFKSLMINPQWRIVSNIISNVFELKTNYLFFTVVLVSNILPQKKKPKRFHLFCGLLDLMLFSSIFIRSISFLFHWLLKVIIWKSIVQNCFNKHNGYAPEEERIIRRSTYIHTNTISNLSRRSIKISKVTFELTPPVRRWSFELIGSLE